MYMAPDYVKVELSVNEAIMGNITCEQHNDILGWHWRDEGFEYCKLTNEDGSPKITYS